MNLFLWILQILLALHTIAGAIWKLTNPAQTEPALKAIPHGIWLAMSAIELLCSVALILPAFGKNFGKWPPIAASLVAAEMLVYCAMDLATGVDNYGHMIYWLIVATICAIIVYGRFVLKPS